MPSDFGILMREYRKRKKLSLDDLAVMVESSKQVLSRYERGERTPKISAAQKIAEALDVPLEILIGYEYHEDPDSAAMAEIEMLEEEIPKTEEARILVKGVDRLPQEERQQLLDMARLMFKKYEGYFEEKGNNNGTKL